MKPFEVSIHYIECERKNLQTKTVKFQQENCNGLYKGLKLQLSGKLELIIVRCLPVATTFKVLKQSDNRTPPNYLS